MAGTMSGLPSSTNTFVIRMSEVPRINEKLSEITEDFGVELVFAVDPGSFDEGNQWVTIKGKSEEDVKAAKAFIIAFCNPDVKEEMYFPGFPFYIFDAFQEKVKRKLQKEFGVVLLMKGDEFIYAHGEELGVASVFSKLLYMHSHSKDLSTKNETQAASQFDRHVKLIGDEYTQKLYNLPNLLKKDILEILEIPLELSEEISHKGIPTAREVNANYLRKIPPRGAMAASSSHDAIRVDSSSQEDECINLCSSDDSYKSDESLYESDDDDVREVENDGQITEPFDISLPPNFLIKEWMKANYEGTSSSNDFVNKSEMLEHFRSHFGLSSHPDLANIFFDRLAVRIFPSENIYRSVRTKRTKSKHSKRRLVCLRRKNVESDNFKTTPISQGLLPTSSASMPIKQSSSTMQEWNSNRSSTSVSLVPVTLRPSPQQPALASQQPPASPYQITQHHPRRQAPPVHDMQPGIGQWLRTAPVYPRKPIPATRHQRQAVGNSIATRVASMNNQELVRRPRPMPNPDLRPIVIDGSNVAMSHGSGNKFSCRGIALCARFFIERGHNDVICLVPNYRKGGGGNPPSFDSQLLIELEDVGILKSTPSRRVAGQNLVCYDDRFIVELAAMNGGVIVSNDQYRDLMVSNPQWRPVIERQLLQYTLVGDLFMFPQDPFGRNGPTLDAFLKSGTNGRRSQALSTPPPPRIPGLVHSQQRHNTPPVNPWTNLALRPPAALTPQQHELVDKMTSMLPHQENAIKRFITRNSGITDIEEMMDRFLQIHSGQ